MGLLLFGTDPICDRGTVREAEQSGGKVQSKAPCGWEGGRGGRQKHQRGGAKVSVSGARERSTDGERGEQR